MPSSSLCADCSINEGTHDIRKRRLCSDCFIRYVNSKVLKRMESYRFKNYVGDQKKRLLLPLSGGVSSLALLHILDAQLIRQRETQKKTAFDLVLVHVVAPDPDSDSAISVSAAWREQTKSRFPSHYFHPPFRLHDAFQVDENLEQDLSHLGIHRRHGQSNSDFFNSIVASSSSATTRTDLKQILLRRLLIASAKQHGCESILWGQSDSKLAAQALADVAKGRGGSVPTGILDGPSNVGLNFNHPLRDLFKSELELYASVLPEPLNAMLETDAVPTPSIRNTSIDSLLSTYIMSQGEKYPSIMANVVRTASKLQVPEMSSEVELCHVCSSLIQREKGWSTQDRRLCYGCEKMKNDIKVG